MNHIAIPLRSALESIIDGYWEQIESLPQGEQRDRLDEKGRRLEDLVGRFHIRSDHD